MFARELLANQLSGTIPSSIGSLTNLQVVYDTFHLRVTEHIALSLTRSLVRVISLCSK